MARFDRPRRPVDPGHVTEAERKIIAEAVRDSQGVDPCRRRGDPAVTPFEAIENRLAVALHLNGKVPNNFMAVFNLNAYRRWKLAGHEDLTDPEARVAGLVNALAEERRHKAGIR